MYLIQDSVSVWSLDEASLVWVLRLETPPFLLPSFFIDPFFSPFWCCFRFHRFCFRWSCSVNGRQNHSCWHYVESELHFGVEYWKSSQPDQKLLITFWQFSSGPPDSNRGQTNECPVWHPVWNPFRVKCLWTNWHNMLLHCYKAGMFGQ